MRISIQASAPPVAVAVQEAKPPSIPPIPPPPAVANISPFGDLLGKLVQLSHVSPQSFQHVTGQIHAALQQAAQTKSGSSSIAELAQRFGEVSRTGNLATLQASPAVSGASADAVAPVAALLADHVDAALQEATRST